MVQHLAKSSTNADALNLIAYALKAKKADFSKVLAMIDNMVTLLGKEQGDDDAQKSMCDKDFEESAEHKKETEEAIASSKANIADMEEQSATLASEVATLQDEIKALDQAVAEATEQRKNEHADFVTYQSQSNAAVQLIEKAKNRMVKFYRPNLYKEAPKRELTDEEKIYASSGRSDMIATDAPQMIAGTTQTVYVQVAAVPAPPPETWGAYEKKEGKSNGVLALMDMLLKELKDENTEATHEEETAQKDYERLMSDSQASRADKADSITSKEKAKADLDVSTENAKEQKTSQEAELMNVNQYIAQLHSTCDFLVQNYDLRKAARSNEIESLKNAKAVLSGADFS
jgi:chromosome segregation ATPase